MKKSFLALSAAAVVGGLGLATSAQAVFFFGPGDITPVAATPVALQLNPGSVGHELLVPYYSTQGATQTLLTLVNTDQVNGKAVKVRFRGATNSDDVLDFTLLLSPGDGWSAALVQGADGLTHLSSSDTSCAVGGGVGTARSNVLLADVPFITGRLASYLDPTVKAANTREGYIEILNMADIPPTTSDNTTPWNSSVTRSTSGNDTNDLYRAIKHVGGTPPCAALWTNGDNKGYDAIVRLENTVTLPNVATPSSIAKGQLNPSTQASQLLASYGLGAPTGGLMGSWFIINQDTLAQYSGNDVAVKATANTDVLFSPQRAEDLSNPGLYTADPLLTGYATTAPVVKAQYYDVPDLSSPFASATGQVLPPSTSDSPTWALNTPTAQAYYLGEAVGRSTIYNEFVNDPTGASTNVPQSTDWIISQPTRRYFAVVDYSTTSAAARIIYNDGWTSNQNYANRINISPSVNTFKLPYAGGSGARGQNVAGTVPVGTWIPIVTPVPDISYGSFPVALGGTGAAAGAGNLTIANSTASGPVACLSSTFDAVYDREETIATAGTVFSPQTSVASVYCGEVATATWGTSPTGASLTNAKLTSSYINGWAVFTPSLGHYSAPWLPFIGYAAESAGNGSTGKSYGLTLPHRWN